MATRRGTGQEFKAPALQPPPPSISSNPKRFQLSKEDLKALRAGPYGRIFAAASPEDSEEDSEEEDLVPEESFRSNFGFRDMAGAPSSARVGYCYDSRMREHKHHSYDHPEQPARISSIFKTLEDSGCTSRMIVLPAREVSEDEVTLVHSRKVWERVNEIEFMTAAQIRKKSRAYTTQSLFINHKTPSSVRLSCGATIEAAMAVADGRCKRSVAIVRPPGHHAEPNESMGFCFFNNVAVAAKVILQKTAIRKVLILDWDVHHGNGVQATFEEDPSVLYISIHRYENASFYPHDTSGSYSSKGKGRGLGFSVNIPWSRGGKGDGDYLYAFEKVVMPIAREFAPEIVLVSAGFDAAEGDPLGECNVTPPGFSRMTNDLCSLADGRVVIVLEGGYNLESTSDSMLAVTKVLLDDPLPPLEETAAPDRSTAKTISDVRRVHASHWKCFQTNRTLVASPSASHRTMVDVTQRKRKRRDSDGEYTPRQGAENKKNKKSTTSTRRASKRLAASAKLEPQPSATTTSTISSRSTVTRRSSSSTSALTSASSSSFDRLPTPKETDASDFPVSTSESALEKSPIGRPGPQKAVDDLSGAISRLERTPFYSVKIGLPPKEKRMGNDRNYSTPTPYRLIKPPPLVLTPLIKRRLNRQIAYTGSAPSSHVKTFQEQQQHSSPPRQTHTAKFSPASQPTPQPAPAEYDCRSSKERQIGFFTVLKGLLESAAPR